VGIPHNLRNFIFLFFFRIFFYLHFFLQLYFLSKFVSKRKETIYIYEPIIDIKGNYYEEIHIDYNRGYFSPEWTGGSRVYYERLFEISDTYEN
jgi:hypothetical protein